MDAATAYDVAIRQVKTVINDADPDGFLAAGAPEDEYADYIADIARRLLHGDDPDSVLSAWTAWHGTGERSRTVDRLREIQRLVTERPKLPI